MSPIRVDFGPKYTDRSGIDITYTKSRQEFSIGGWYDGCVGIENESISLGDFLRKFGITLKDCEKALR